MACDSRFWERALRICSRVWFWYSFGGGWIVVDVVAVMDVHLLVSIVVDGVVTVVVVVAVGAGVVVVVVGAVVVAVPPNEKLPPVSVVVAVF